MNACVQGGKLIPMPVEEWSGHGFVYFLLPMQEEAKSLVIYHLTFFICHLHHMKALLWFGRRPQASQPARAIK
jgi:hypothetical protein